ncbi:MAG: hypothetical protein Q9183_002908 [Haloplaca sp. 2 TL-2023]
MGSRTQSMTSNTSATDFHSRRDFSPSAVPPPLSTRGSPSPHTRSDPQSGWRPPRKSSLSQSNQSEQPYFSPGPAVAGGFGPEEEITQSRERAGSGTGKPLPFVRPAEIYKRMHEEKERERQSQDSSRPSMDAIMGDGGTADQPGSETERVPMHNRDVENTRQLRSPLDPVAERKSEYGMTGFPEPEATSRDQQQTLGSGTTKSAEPSKITQTLSPQLPDLARMSGFGELFGNTSRRPDSQPPEAAPQTSERQPDTSLQHQPSFGLRSVVHQAFDTTNDPRPETPASSTAESSMGRSGSGGTSAVSPIISRGPSSATTYGQPTATLARPDTPPNMDEEVGNEDRPTSSGSLGTPKAISRKFTSDSGNQRPGSFRPGHRRDLSTPSPDNSPARTPAVEAHKQLQQPQEAELAMTTPIETHFPQSNGPSESAAGGPPSHGRNVAPESTDISTPRASRGNFRHTDSTNLPNSLPGETPKSPAESSRSRVRNLADKFESGRSSPAGSERAPSPVKTNFAQNQMNQQSRPLAGDRLESFRPKLPGGWESSVSLAHAEHQSKGETTSSTVSLEQRLQDPETDRQDVLAPTSSQAPDNESETATADRGDRGGSKSVGGTSSSDPFASLAAAGSALAEAFSGMGSGKDDQGSGQAVGSPDGDGSEPRSTTGQGSSSAEYTRAAPRNTTFMPEASKPNMLATPDDGTSSIMPTPMDKMAMPGQSNSDKSADYFATGAMPKQQWSGDSYATGTTRSSDRPDLTPSLSVDAGPQYESDRLRREIIRELSPRLPNEPSRTGPETLPATGADTPADAKARAGPHESMVLPREYDSYWQGSGSERSSRASSAGGPTRIAKDTARTVDTKESSPYPPDMNNNSLPVVEPPSSRSNQPERPEIAPHRFSWEAPSEVVSPRQQPLGEAQPPSLHDTESPTDRSEDQMKDHHDGHQDQQNHDAFTAADHSAGHPQERMSFQEVGLNETDRGAPSVGKEPPTSSGLAGILQDLPPSATAMSLAPEMEKDRLDEGSQHVDAEFEPQPRSMQTTQESQVPSAPPQIPPKIQSFREILAMKDPKDRIRAYNEARMQFAHMDTGLSNWLTVTTAELPEHKEVLPHGKLPGIAGYKPSPSRSKLGGLFPSGNSSGPQPYYQQYLNASSPTGASGGTTMPRTNSTSGYSPSNNTGKLSSQQMQARGKDLLHSAGVFGGKANVAAKGLFSKGKTRFRGGNADKAPLSTFNTAHTRGMQPRPELVSPISPNSPSVAERPDLTKHSGESRPVSDLSENENPSTQEIPHQQPSADDYSHPRSSHERVSSDNFRWQGLKDERPAPHETSAENALGRSEVVQSSDGQEKLPTSRLDSGQSPHSSVGHNRTPTQADYADYFRRGSSPSVRVPKASSVSPDSRAVDTGDPIEQSRFQQQSTSPQPENTLRSKFSTQDREEIPLANTGEVTSEQYPSVATQSTVNRESGDSRETFATAPSKVHKHPEESAAGAAHDTSDKVEDSSVGGSTEDGSSSHGSIKAATPVAVPAANIQDRPGGRPFSFIQFSQNTTPAPLEDYSHRKPSVDSVPSQIDPEQDAPPSPMSSSQPAVPRQSSRATTKVPLYHDVRHDFAPDTSRRFSSSPSRSFSRPFQDNNAFQGQPATREEQSAPEQEDMPAQHYPAAIPRQEMVHPRQQATEYSLEGVGPPPPVPRTATNRSTSKRGSRSSAFFRSFKSPTESTAPALPGEGDDEKAADISEESRIRKSKSRRSSLFRSLTKGSKASSTDDASQRLSERPRGPSLQNSPQPPPSSVPPSGTEPNTAPADVPNKHRNRLSKTTTGNDVEQKAPEPAPPGKKKRFSGLGI